MGLGTGALASTIRLNVLPLNGPVRSCPESLIAHETPKPYFEGGYARDGMIKLKEIATNIRLVQSDPFSTTWIGTLKPTYQSCQASAIINNVDGESYQNHSYLQVQLIDGQARVTLDMTGIRDANGLTSTITFRGLRDGNPRWTWGGTD